MATVKSRIRRLEQQQHRQLMEWIIRQFENRSPEEFDFFARHGYFETWNDNQRVVKPEEVWVFEEKLRAIGVAMRGRSEADREHYIEHGSWPECGQSVAESCKSEAAVAGSIYRLATASDNQENSEA
jgi:hypothetical protein